MAITAYKRRRPEQTGLWQAVQKYWLPFLEETSARGAVPPKFVQRGFQKYLKCGDLSHGFARVRCCDCGDERLVAFSCKVRGLCSSCDGRRMIETAAHLTDSVIPNVPIRQFVFTMPYWLRYKIAWDSKLFSEVHKVFTNAMRAWLRKRARALGFDEAEVGATAHAHRFGDGLRLSPHIHALYADGVWCKEPGDPADSPPRFIYLPEPTDAEIAELVRSLHHKTLRRLMRIGVIQEDIDADEDFAREQPMLARCTSASMLDRVAIGEREGELVWRERIEPPKEKRVGRLCAMYEGFNIHARTTVGAYARDQLEKLIRYVARPAVCVERIDLLKGDLVRMRLRSTWSDGSVAKIFEAKDAMAKLAMLIPAPNTNAIRYVGVFSAHHRWRSEIVPPTPPSSTGETSAKPIKKSGKSARERKTWADLMRRGFQLDVLACECGGRRKVISVIEDVAVARRILRHLGLPAEPALFRAPRPPPTSCAPRHDRASELDSWDCVDELMAEEDYSQEWGEAVAR